MFDVENCRLYIAPGATRTPSRGSLTLQHPSYWHVLFQQAMVTPDFGDPSLSSCVKIVTCPTCLLHVVLLACYMNMPCLGWAQTVGNNTLPVPTHVLTTQSGCNQSLTDVRA
jgi:hypothetical protein